MGSTKRGPTRDEMDRLFDELAADAIAKTAGREELDGRVWRLAKSVPHFYLGAEPGARDPEVAGHVERLRSRAVSLINALPVADKIRGELEDRLGEAASHCVFRPWAISDLDTFRRLLDDEELWRFLPEDYPGALGEEAATGLIAHSNMGAERHEVRAVVWDGEVVGQARLQFDSDPDPASAEISYWLGRPHWGKGLGSQIVTLYTARSFEQRPGLQRIFAKVLHGNLGSIRVLERARYRREAYRHHGAAKAGREVGLHTFSVFRSDYPSRTSGSGRGSVHGVEVGGATAKA